MKFKIYSLIVLIFSCNFLLCNSEENSFIQTNIQKLPYTEPVPEASFHKQLPAYNAPARIEVQAPWGFSLCAGFIYWIPKQVGMDLGIAIPPNLNAHSDEIIEFNTSYYPGFTAKLGTPFGYDNWQASIKYTRFHAKEYKTKIPPSWSNGILYEIFSGAFSLLPYISAKWNPKLDIFDLEVGRPYYAGRNLIIEPNISARGGWTSQSFKLHATPLGIYQEANMRTKSLFLGPRIAANLNWLLSYGLRMFVNSSASILYQRMRTEYKFQAIQNPAFFTRNNETKTKQLTPNMELSCGFGWSTYLDHNNWHIGASAKYDFLYFWNQNEFLGIQSLLDRYNYHATGDLMLHGLEITLEVSF